MRYGGLALTDPVSTAVTAFKVSRTSTAILQEVVKSGNPVNITDHDECCCTVTNDWGKERAPQQATQLEQLLQEMPVGLQRTLRHMTKNTSNAS